MLKYYSVPGKLLAEFWFLWSKKGQLWGSARRRDHPFVHFFYSTIIYAITAFAVFVWMADWETPRREGENQSEYTAAIDPSPGEIISPEADVRLTDGAAFDLDASAFVLGANDKVLSDAHFIFYNNKSTPDGAVIYGGDNRTGAGAGDDETIKIDFAKLGADVKKVVVAVTIHEGVERRQNFGSVSNAYARVLDDADGKELARFDLSEDGSANTSLIFVELYRGPQGDIKVKAIGEGWASGLSGLAGSMGVTLG